MAPSRDHTRPCCTGWEGKLVELVGILPMLVRIDMRATANVQFEIINSVVLSV